MKYVVKIMMLVGLIISCLASIITAQELDFMKGAGIEIQNWPSQRMSLEEKMIGYWLCTDSEGLFILYHFTEHYGETFWAHFGKQFMFPMMSFSYKIVEKDESLQRIVLQIDAGSKANEFLAQMSRGDAHGEITETYDMAIGKRAMIKITEISKLTFYYIDQDIAKRVVNRFGLALYGRFPKNVRKQEWTETMPLEQKLLGRWLVYDEVGSEPSSPSYWYISRDKIYLENIACTYEIIRKEEDIQRVTTALTCPQKDDDVIQAIYLFDMAHDVRAMRRIQQVQGFGVEITTDLLYVDNQQHP